MTRNYDKKLSPRNYDTKSLQEIMTLNHYMKLSPSVLSHQKVMTYRDTAYLKISSYI